MLRRCSWPSCCVGLVNYVSVITLLSVVQHKLEGALLALGQFQHALSELQSWLSHTHATLDTQRPVGSDPKAIEIELAKHHVSSFLSISRSARLSVYLSICQTLCLSLDLSDVLSVCLSGSSFPVWILSSFS